MTSPEKVLVGPAAAAELRESGVWSDDLHLEVPPEPRAMAVDQPCGLVTFHAPHPVMTQHHHQKPVFLQNRLYGKIVYGPSLWLCGSCHDSVHAWLYWLLGERQKPERIGYAAKREAEATYAWFRAERLRLARRP